MSGHGSRPVTQTSRSLPRPLDIKHCIENEPPPLDFVLPGFLAGTVGGLIAAGGVGKSTIALHAAFDIAVEGAGLLDLEVERHGRVVILAGEDPPAILHQRIRAISARLTPSQRKAATDALRIHACVGEGLDVLDEDWYDSIREQCVGARLVILDTLTRFHSVDENDAADAKAVMSALERLAAQTGAAVLYLHHVSKGAALSGAADLQQAARGSSVFVDNARWISYVAGVSPEDVKAHGLSGVDKRRFVRLGVSKQNYGAPMAERWYERTDQGALVPSSGPVQSGKVVGKAVKQTPRPRGRSGLPPSSTAWE